MPFSRQRNSLINRENFPVLREFRLARLGFAAVRCIPEAESRNIKGLVLIFFGLALARARTRARWAGRGSRTASRRCIAVAIVALALIATGAAAMAADEKACLENASLAELQQALTEGRTTASALIRAYLARIEAYDRAGPHLNSVREINPDALAIAASFDRVKPNPKQPLAGIPILVKDNIATGDKQHTTAGSLALAEARAKRDALVVARLRAAGAVILGKANLTEFANILAIDMPAGYSSLGGQVKNPYAPGLDDKGVPVVSPGGSSAGSAVAVTAGLAAAAIGTETSGSLLSPATQNGVVTVKPTIGLISRTGILPIAHSQDTAGPLTRTVRDAAILLNVLAGPDPRDPATLPLKRPPDYTKFLDENGLKGARIGVPSDPSDPANDFYYRSISPRAHAAIGEVIATLEAQGATIVRANIPTEGWIGGPGTEMAILNRNPESRTKYEPARRSVVFVYELKHDLNTYLRDWLTGTQMHTMGDIIAFNAAHAEKALRFGQDIFVAAEATRGDLSELEYKSARAMDLRASRARGLDSYMDKYRLDAVLFPGVAGAAIAAKAGYPSVQVPAGFLRGNEMPEYPLGATFTGRAWSEPTLLRIAYAFEQATKARQMPPGVPPLDEGCAR
jgi:amidase